MDSEDKKNQKGLTLVELMLSLTIGLVVLCALTTTFILQRKIFDAQEQKVEALQTARAAINMMIQEVMMAGYNPDTSSALQQHDDTLPTFSGIVYDATKTELEIRADIDGGGDIVEDDSVADPNKWKYNKNERIVYKKIGDQLKRKTGGGYFQPFAENINAFNFEYLKADGTMATRESDIRNVEIMIEVETEKPDMNGEYKTSRLVTWVNLRNMGLYE